MVIKPRYLTGLFFSSRNILWWSRHLSGAAALRVWVEIGSDFFLWILLFPLTLHRPKQVTQPWPCWLSTRKHSPAFFLEWKEIGRPHEPRRWVSYQLRSDWLLLMVLEPYALRSHFGEDTTQGHHFLLFLFFFPFLTRKLLPKHCIVLQIFLR